MPRRHSTLVSFVSSLALGLGALGLGACSDGGQTHGSSGGNTVGLGGSTGSGGDTGSAGGDTGAGGTTASGGGDTGGAGGDTGAGGTAASGGATGAGGNTGSGGGTTPTGGNPGTSGTGGTTGAGGASGTGGTTGGSGGTGGDTGDPPPPRPLNVTGGGTFSKSFNGQPMYVDKTKKMLGKLVIYLGGIGGGPGSGGIDAFAHKYGFHNFMPATDTNLTGDKVPAMYKGYLTDSDPTNDHEANRQIGDARTDLWDGKGRVTWHTVAPGASILAETLGAIQYGEANDPGGDWGYFLNADGTLRLSDVWVVGYSWGSQTWAMMSTYIRFGRVIVTSGPVNEGWPNASWMTDPSATPLDRKFALVADSQATEIFPNVMKAGWLGSIVNVMTTSKGPYTSDQHLFEMIGGDGGTTPGGHTVFCNDNPANGWIPVCTYVFGQQP